MVYENQILFSWLTCIFPINIYVGITANSIRYSKLTEGSREIILTVLSDKPTARKRHLCSPTGTLPKAIHTTSDDISFLSVYSFNCPVCKNNQEDLIHGSDTIKNVKHQLTRISVKL